jgi:hypothetical protein
MKGIIKESLVDFGLFCIIIFNYAILSIPAVGSFGCFIKYLFSQAFLTLM